MAKDYKRLHGLTIEQQNAIDLLLLGKTDKEVAEAIGVNRVTVTNWRLYDPYFQAELNRRRQEVWSAAIEKLRGLVLKALDIVEKNLEKGNLEVALEILKIARLNKVDLSDVGETDENKLVLTQQFKAMADDLQKRLMEKMYNDDGNMVEL